MNIEVVNYENKQGTIEVGAVSSSSLFLIGDAETLVLSSMFDTPPESLIIGPFVPLTPQ
ncbi:spore gernimation protein GerPD [Bacillaceae bacterium SIJ1]|uniref:spore gernimation protein GerPD n=1 Tax=Litoribacterium kuwaitense TaxID=1398745 RepID=UPI0013EC0213|nr:spore gernimation protein GerPD [Litoribacterium kuwaitense]NGP44517.1 spore gernimation protein GerPD [Litoribacterium kuwaitense]